MKVRKVNKPEQKSFKPFDIVISVDSETELAYLWGCTNLSKSKIIEATSQNTRFRHSKMMQKINDSCQCNQLWDLLNTEAVACGLKEET